MKCTLEFGREGGNEVAAWKDFYVDERTISVKNGNLK